MSLNKRAQEKRRTSRSQSDFKPQMSQPAVDNFLMEKLWLAGSLLRLQQRQVEESTGLNEMFLFMSGPEEVH